MRRYDIETTPKLFCDTNHKLHMIIATIERAIIVREKSEVYYEWRCDICGRIYRLKAPEIIILELDDKDIKSISSKEIPIKRGESIEEDKSNSEKDL
jgi:hypothetical protein